MKKADFLAKKAKAWRAPEGFAKDNPGDVFIAGFCDACFHSLEAAGGFEWIYSQLNEDDEVIKIYDYTHREGLLAYKTGFMSGLTGVPKTLPPWGTKLQREITMFCYQAGRALGERESHEGERCKSI